MRKVFITGISGFAGYYLARLLFQEKNEVYGLVRSTNRLHNFSELKNYITFQTGDITNRACLKNILKEVKPDYIFHLASLSHLPESNKNPQKTFAVNVIGTVNLYDAVVESEIHPRILFVGSSESYGFVKKSELPITESTLLKPSNFYSLSKYSAEMISYQYFLEKDLDIVRVRPFNHTGPGQNQQFVCSSFAKQIAEIEKGLRPPKIEVGNLQAKRDFIDVRDVVVSYWFALLKGIKGDVYNICSEESISMQSILEKLISFSDVDVSIIIKPELFRKYDVPEYCGDSSRFRDTTGWKKKISINKTLKDLLNFWRDSLS